MEQILIVDDEEINRAILLETFGDKFDILEAEDGLAAIQMLRTKSEEISAVLLDIIMPKMDGLDVLACMKEEKIHVPVFLITADTSFQTMQRGYKLGAVDIIGKPITPFFVRRRVEHVIELNQAKKSLSDMVKHQEQIIEEKVKEIQRLNKSFIEALSTAIEFRDSESGEHVHRIYKLTKMMLHEMKDHDLSSYHLTEDDIEQIATASIMHDVGKIAISDTILNKPGKLTEEEFETMKQHTVLGCEILDRIPRIKSIPVYRYAYDICRYHHEKWDGKGYPDGLKGDEIPIWAQIVALSDCYDALINKRVYKPAYSHEKAVSMILNGECGVFNPVLLQNFQKIEKTLKSMNKKESENFRDAQ